MGKRKRKMKSGTNVKAKHKKTVKFAPLPWNGDHGTGTKAANENTLVVPIKDNPNRMAQRVRRDNVKDLLGRLTVEQYTVAQAIQDAMSKIDSLSSGGELKEQVDSCPDPSKPATSMAEAMSKLRRYTDHVPRTQRPLVDAICGPVSYSETQLAAKFPRWLWRFKLCMELVARRV